MNKERKTEKFTTYPYSDQVEYLKTEALKRGKGVTAADVLREILDKYINNQKGDNN